MNIVVKAEPRYYIDISESDAHLINSVLVKIANKSTEAMCASKLVADWLQRMHDRKEYREVCEAAGYYVSTSSMVNATHTELESLCMILNRPGLMNAWQAARLADLHKAFAAAIASANRQFQHGVLT